jgi:murein DD-endopeptidase MepM/ murein hydrolase activator NlpD
VKLDTGGVEIDNPVPGGRMGDGLGAGRGHLGQDICAAEGTPVHTAAAGIVISAGWNGGYGNCVVIQHGDGTITTLYGHLRTILVRVGQHVARREIIGYVGHSGHATGNHLHFEIRIRGRIANPRDFIG